MVVKFLQPEGDISEIYVQLCILGTNDHPPFSRWDVTHLGTTRFYSVSPQDAISFEYSILTPHLAKSLKS